MPRPLAPPARQIHPVRDVPPPSRLPSLAAPHAIFHHKLLGRPAPSGCASPHACFAPTGSAAPHVGASLTGLGFLPHGRASPTGIGFLAAAPSILSALHTSYSSKPRTAPQPATSHLFLVSSSMCCFSGNGLHLLLTTEQAGEDNLDRHSTPRLLLQDPSCSPPSRLWKMNCITVNIKEAMKTTQVSCLCLLRCGRELMPSGVPALKDVHPQPTAQSFAPRRSSTPPPMTPYHYGCPSSSTFVPDVEWTWEQGMVKLWEVQQMQVLRLHTNVLAGRCISANREMGT